MKFNLLINLDDETEVASFIAEHGTTKGRRLANRLDLRGKGSARGATAISGYAWNKHVAIEQRKLGNIATAQQYEAVCDRIYRENIQPHFNAW